MLKSRGLRIRDFRNDRIVDRLYVETQTAIGTALSAIRQSMEMRGIADDLYKALKGIAHVCKQDKPDAVKVQQILNVCQHTVNKYVA